MSDWLTHVVGAALAAVLAVLGVPTAGEPPHQPPALLGAPTALHRLHVAPETDAATYDRDLFGRGWTDLDHDGCNTREEIMARDLTDVHKAADGCNVVYGVITRDRYTGKRIVYTEAHSQDVQIDHIVALSDAWRSGASRWTPARRVAYANDPFVLWAVDGPSNNVKSDKGPDRWQPKDPTFECTYVRRYVQIKYKYRLTITNSQRVALTRDLEACR